MITIIKVILVISIWCLGAYFDEKISDIVLGEDHAVMFNIIVLAIGGFTLYIFRKKEEEKQ